MGLYKNIKNAAKMKGLSISELERLCNIPKGSICRFDKNKPSAIRLSKIADELGVTINDLVSEEDQKPIVHFVVDTSYSMKPSLEVPVINKDDDFAGSLDQAFDMVKVLSNDEELRNLFDICKKVDKSKLARIKRYADLVLKGEL